MNHWLRRAAVSAMALAVAGLTLAAGAGARAGQSKTVQLFNGKNFEGWYIFIPGQEKNKDPLGIFKIEDGVIHVSGEKFAYLSTEKEYENYKLTLEFKWGEKRYPPRENAKRDAGVLYHCVGQDKVWMKSLECQIQEGDCGDMWLTGGEGGAPSLTVKGKRYTGGRVVKFADYEKPNGEWNKVEVICKGDAIQHYINGKLNMEGTEASLTKGKINLQSEGAELYYRNITLEPLQ
jgi:3-keto-disaccharide hydrolase